MAESFRQRVWAAVRGIPEGRVSTYGNVAAVLGSPRAARQVGYAMAASPDDVPWHRVINAKGMVSGRGDVPRVALQHALLEAEGVRFDARGCCDLDGLRWSFDPMDAA